jgi:hypothetical protein
MTTIMQEGSGGESVRRLHRILLSAGYRIADSEIETSSFGATTRTALSQLQDKHNLRPTGEVDEKTQTLLLSLEERLESKGRKKKNQSKRSRSESKDGGDLSIQLQPEPEPKEAKPEGSHPDESRGSVRGKLVNEDGAPIAATHVSLFAKHVRSEKHLGDATTNNQGQYSISYHRPSALNLVVRAYDALGKLIAESVTVFAAAAQIQINFTTAANGVLRPPSTFTTISAAVAEQLQGIPLSDLKENKDTHELQFLASAADLSFDDVAYVFIALALGTENKIQDGTFFGIFYQGVPASLDAALASLPDAGIDDAFTAQVLSGVLAHSRAALSQTLTAAVSANVLPASYAATQDSELTLLDGLRTQSVGNSPYISGKTSLNDLLAAGGVVDAVKTAFTQAYADNGGQLGPTWKTLRANKNLSAADLATLNTTLSLGELLRGNLPIIQDTLRRLSQKTLASIQALALLSGVFLRRRSPAFRPWRFLTRATGWRGSRL